MGGLDFDIIVRTWPYLLKGLQYTVQLTIVAAIGGTIFGTLLAMARLSSFKWLSMTAAGYVNLMRSIPLLLVIFWFYFLLPIILQAINRRRATTAVWCGAFGLCHLHHVRGGLFL